MMDDDKKLLIDTNKENLSRVISFANVMDGKATFILTLVLALTGYLVSQLGPYLDAHAHWASTNWAPTFFFLLDVAAFGCLACFTTTAIYVVRCIKPRVKRHTGKTSPLFFGTIAEGSHEEFKAIMKTLTPESVIDTLADQTFDIAKIVQEKMCNVQHGFTYFLCGLCCFLAFTIARPIVLSLSQPPIEKPAKPATVGDATTGRVSLWDVRGTHL